MMRDDEVVAGSRSVEVDLLVTVHPGSPIKPQHLVVLRHAERLHALAILGLDAFDLQFAPDTKDTSFCLRSSCSLRVSRGERKRSIPQGSFPGTRSGDERY